MTFLEEQSRFRSLIGSLGTCPCRNAGDPEHLRNRDADAGRAGADGGVVAVADGEGLPTAGQQPRVGTEGTPAQTDRRAGKQQDVPARRHHGPHVPADILLVRVLPLAQHEPPHGGHPQRPQVHQSEVN